MTTPAIPTTRADLEALLGQEESQVLEFKASEALKNQKWKSEIAKDVSAMANATGGMIVYGIKEKAGVASEIDEGVPHETITADTINRVLNANIQPPIQGMAVRRITLGENRFGYTIEVPPPGSDAPHQVPERGCYYQRQGREIRMLLDFQIRAIMGRRTSPDLFVDFIFVRHDAGADIFSLQGIMKNASSEPALYCSFDVLTDVALGVTESHETIPATLRYEMCDARDGKHICNNYSGSIRVPHHQPIYRERPMTLFRKVLRLQPDRFYALAYNVATPGCAKKVTGALFMEGYQPKVVLDSFFMRVPAWDHVVTLNGDGIAR